MANHPNRSQSARKQAQALGYFVREGKEYNSADNQAGRWYFGHRDDNGFRPWGAGYASQRLAWAAALEHSERVPLDPALLPNPYQDWESTP